MGKRIGFVCLFVLFVTSIDFSYGQILRDEVAQKVNEKNTSEKPLNAYIDINLWDAPNLRKQSSEIEVWVYDALYYPNLVRQPKFGPTKLKMYYNYRPGSPATVQLTEGTPFFPMNDYEVDGSKIDGYLLSEKQKVACSVTNVTDFLGVWLCRVYFAPEPRPGYYDDGWNQQPEVDLIQKK